MKSVPLSFQNPVEFLALLHFSQHNPLAALIPTNYPEMACEAYYSLIFIRYQPTIVAISYPECGCSIAAFSRPPPRCYPLSYRPSLLYCFVPMGPVAHS
jgi:hypothetical protein